MADRRRQPPGHDIRWRQFELTGLGSVAASVPQLLGGLPGQAKRGREPVHGMRARPPGPAVFHVRDRTDAEVGLLRQLLLGEPGGLPVPAEYTAEGTGSFANRYIAHNDAHPFLSEREKHQMSDKAP
jgi:hypothetical protein